MMARRDFLKTSVAAGVVAMTSTALAQGKIKPGAQDVLLVVDVQNCFVPGGNLGNCSAFGKAFEELLYLGLIKKAPRLAIINAQGANTLHSVVNKLGVTWNNGQPDNGKIKAVYAGMDEANYHPHTVASAIEISRPVNLKKALRALDVMKGVVAEVTQERKLLAVACKRWLGADATTDPRASL